ncbi:MAG: bifunctional diaminohydroxyphosphoribosylaminopyrimidine deaminase/5-amino-6-(5-phosphoribosylamino)uracil reductase RibD [Actinomycetes bacterium]
MVSAAEYEAMTRALAIASESDRATHPNPRVGAVLIDPDGQVVGTGLHRGPGQAHAEAAAIAAAGPAARGATAVVTLEPCSHFGRTGPCTDALVAAGVDRVVFAQSDPNPLAAGGAAVLRANGIDVEGDVLADEARKLNPIWSYAMERRRPLVTWKFAATVDGRVAAADGTSRWISGDHSRAEVHTLRGSADAVLVGTGTVLADDPQLTARRADGSLMPNQPLRVVVGRRDLPTAAHVLDRSAPTLVWANAELSALLDELFARDVHDALLEGGPTLAAAFLRADLVDRVVAYVGPKVLGSGPTVVGSLGTHTMSQARPLHFDDVRRSGDDIRWTGRFHLDAPALGVPAVDQAPEAAREESHRCLPE